MRAPLAIAAATLLVAGVGGSLLLPAVPPWPLAWLCFACGLGFWLHGGRWQWLGPALLGFGLAGLHVGSLLAQQLPVAMEGDEVAITGRVVGLPQPESRRTRFRMRVEDEAPAALRGKLLDLAWYDDYGATEPGPRAGLGSGDVWRMRVKLRAPRGLRNPGGFDRERYLLSQRVAATGYVRDPESAARIAARRGIDAWRQQVSARIGASVASPSARFVRALALGDTGGLADADWESLRATGLTHLIAISGFHVGLAAGFFALLARALWWLLPSLCLRIPRPQAAGIAAAVGALVYAAVAGFALPTVRTLLMIVVVVAASLLRRQQHAAEALALAAIAMLLVDPLAILAPGFWLSFMGVAWLVWCMPRGEGNVPRDFLKAQGVATVALLPLTVVFFGQASLAGPFANIVAVPWWSLVVVPLSLLGVVADTLHGGAGALFWNWSAWAFDLSWPLFERLAASRFALWWLPEARWYAVPMALLGAFWLLLPRGVPGKTLALCLWLPLLWPDRQLPKQGEAELAMLDVGQGLAVVVRTATRTLLYDAGPAAAEGWDAGERVVVPAFRALGVRKLDMLVVSHGDRDHAGGVEAVSRAFPAAQALGPPGDPLPLTADCRQGTRWEWDGVRFEILHPDRYFPYLKNESSCVLRIETAHGAALLTGDIGEIVERMLVDDAGDGLRADVVSVAHHGSRGSSDPAFVQAIAAKLALVSSGHGNRFRHPADAVVERWQQAGAQVLATSQSGAMRVRLTQSGIGVRTHRASLRRPWDAERRRHAFRVADCDGGGEASDTGCATDLESGLSYRPD